MPAPDSIKCLIVDDVAENLTALEALLRGDGVDVLSASSGFEALELLLKHDVALALLDVHMPDMDGFELAELMRGTERSRHVPIIFVTAASREPQRVFRGYETGAVDFLFKPIDPNILRHKADTFFALYRRKQELARALQVRDDVLAVVSHDLRDPLNVVAMAGSMLQQIGTEKNEPQTLEIAGMLQRSVERMQRMIADLLDMATLRSGRLSIQTRRGEVAGLLGEAVAAWQPAAQKKRIDLRCEMPQDNGDLQFDRQRMLQVFSNLIGNAIKFCDTGASIVVSALVERDSVRFSVVDTGPGIKDGDLDKLFDPYWSGGREARGGTGLGLYITRGIVEAHGGRIWAENRGDGGAALRFVLPKA
ncbi:MAG: His Kinase (Phospho-acceptor) protein [Hydrocarboniphaga sp.]|uniref:hybrid sensor histidine kinase/response regulator n=1 Tax=Hydrocarboniphaga sp. TaxID=2033016 RepID=UPI00260ABFD2|nr:ATP-binding protein [Hydrocarboniphaga sp.]MDB5971694.1 His Kinase (Phospho-acceptor) protein [Hydrocarboniphaga sp.]